MTFSENEAELAHDEQDSVVDGVEADEQESASDSEQEWAPDEPAEEEEPLAGADEAIDEEPSLAPGTHEFFASCPFGLIGVAADELRALGLKIRPLQSGVAFYGPLEDAYRACLWGRSLSRVLIVLKRIDASNTDELYTGVYLIPWEEHIPRGATISVDAIGMSDTLRNTSFTALRAKDAICDRLRAHAKWRPDVDKQDADIQIQIALRGDRATVSLNLSGRPLHERGYREPGVQGLAPMKESLAAGMLLWAGWDKMCAEAFERAEEASDAESSLELAFADPMCGTGTLVLEAALIAYDLAPGLLRRRWGFSAWKQHDAEAWTELLDEARERARAASTRRIPFFASDVDPEALSLARACAERAGLGKLLSFHEAELAKIRSYPVKRGLVAVNPPYGERLASTAQLPILYAQMGALMRGLDDWGLVLISPDEGIDAFLGAKPERAEDVYNGRIEAKFRYYAPEGFGAYASEFGQESDSDLDSGAVVRPCKVRIRDEVLPVSEANTLEFVNRLAKRAAHLRKWARRNEIFSYRIYDADLPDYNVAIDWYGAADGEEASIVIYEYAAPREVDVDRARRRMADVVLTTPAVLGVPADRVFVKERKRSRPEQRERSHSSAKLVTKEGGLLFELNLSDYLDTGLFLDHRIVRGMLADMVREKNEELGRSCRFLNLFAYTGSASVYAASAGALTTSVDLSQTYLDWATRNMCLNHIDLKRQRFEREGCMRWIQNARQDKRNWDLIFVDPPSFSNTNSKGAADWDVQRDHVELLIGVSRLLSRGGIAVFSCNLRNFKPDVEALERAGVSLEDISEKTIDEDFARNPKIHRCYLVRRVPRPHREGDEFGKTGEGGKKPYGDRKPYGDKKAYGYKDRREDKPRDGKKPYGDKRSFGEKKPYDEKRSYGNRSEGASYDKKPYGEKKAYGTRSDGARGTEGRRFDDRKPGDRKPGDSKSDGYKRDDRKSYDHRSDDRAHGDRKPFDRNRDDRGHEGRGNRGDRKPFNRKPGGRKDDGRSHDES